jgi:hypothetical protein
LKAVGKAGRGSEDEIAATLVFQLGEPDLELECLDFVHQTLDPSRILSARFHHTTPSLPSNISRPGSGYKRRLRAVKFLQAFGMNPTAARRADHASAHFAAVFTLARFIRLC